MINIDFLPVQYHQKNAYRQSKPWQIIVVTSFLGLVALLTISQKVHRRFVEKELGELDSAYETALAQEQRLSDVQNQAKQMESEAELITYMHHPWPRSQLLSALFSRLPEEITLEQLQITIEADNSVPASDRRPPTHLGNSGDPQKTLSPAERDLQTLQNQSDGKQTVVILIGSTTDSAAVPRFLNEILSNPLFSKAELGSVTSVNESSGTAIQFQAKLVVKPGYGQRGGPADNQKTYRLQSSAGNDYANN